MNWNDIFEYRDGVLYWKVSRRCINAGSRAGYVQEDGYTRITFESKQYLQHRIVWLMHGRTIPEGMEIDHIDHNRQNDRIENLRLVSAVVNCQNKGKYISNTSGVTGVSWDRKNLKWFVTIRVHKKNVFLGRLTNLMKRLRYERKRNCGTISTQTTVNDG